MLNESKLENRRLFSAVPAASGTDRRRLDSVPSPYRKLGSPELRPLPPLPPRLFMKGSCRYEVEAGYDSGSPSAEKESSGLISAASRRGSPAVEASSSSAYRSPAVPGTFKSPNFSSTPSRSRASASPAWLSSESSVVSLPTSSPDYHFTAMPPPETMAKPKLKPLRWEKAMPSSDHAMVWDQMRSNSSSRLNEKMIETVVSDSKKLHSIIFLLKALNVTKEEVCEALLEGNIENLSIELLETLLKIAPTEEEEIKLKSYLDSLHIKLSPAEKFLKTVIGIPFAFKRIDAMLYIANFDSEVAHLKRSFETLVAACEELRNSRLFHNLLEAVLKSGNMMNSATNRSDYPHAFKLDKLLKLISIRSADGQATLLHFVVQEIIGRKGSCHSSSNFNSGQLKNIELQALAGLSNELSNVKKAAGIDSDVLGSCVAKLVEGIDKISEVLRLNESAKMQGFSPKFSRSMDRFLKKAEEEIILVQAHKSIALSLVKEIIEYFHGCSSKEAANPLRPFIIMRDFLDILDGVCREVATMNQTIIHPIVYSEPYNFSL